MRFHALAVDYDGTLAHDGRVDENTLAALERLRATGRHLILVTGRELDDLIATFPELSFFEWVVAENGALLYRPANREEKVLAPPPSAEFVEELARRGVQPVSVGRGIVATWQPHETVVLETIRDVGLELHVTFNKGAVMVLPANVNKATGLKAALSELQLSPHEVAGIGDAENDHAFLSICECAAATANAIPALKERVDFVTRGDHGDGVRELIDLLIENDLSDREDLLTRHHLLFGTRDDGTEVRLPPYGSNVLVAGPSGSGKSTSATSLLERLGEGAYQFCIIDPEGDYEGLDGAVTLGTGQRGPEVDEVLDVLAGPRQNAVVNMIGVPLADRPPFFLALLSRLLEMRTKTARPHWLIVDEAHHLLPANWQPGSQAISDQLRGTLFVTVHPDQVAVPMLATVGTIIAVGASPEQTIGQFCQVLNEPPPKLPSKELEPGEVVLWQRSAGLAPCRIKVAPSSIERHRHTRKYAEGELPPDRSFYFRGPKGKLNLRAQNLMLFLQLADGVDDETWKYHLERRDYSQWFRERIKDDRLADEVEKIEKNSAVAPTESRQLIREVIERYYTLPASTPLPMPGTDAAPTHG